MKRIVAITLAILLCAAMLLPLAMRVVAEGENSASAASAEIQDPHAPGALSGETDRTTTEITLSDGTKTGVNWTQIKLDGTYGNKEVNVAEFSLSNKNLSVEVINSGKSIVNLQTTAIASDSYTKNHDGQTVLAAINGDLFMTAVHSGSAVTTKTLRATRGALILDREIWASQQIDQENLDATNAEKGTPAGDKAAFGVTSQNQPLVGSPDIKLTLTVNGKTIEADGLNRLPARNALIVYNSRMNSIDNSNYALDDAYEVEIEMDSTAIYAGGTISGTVKAIYPQNSTTRPALSEGCIVLTARGNKVSTLEEGFKVGDSVSLSTTLTDRWGNTELWQDVTEAIGGHIPVMLDGRQATALGSSSEYPTTLIGYKDNGDVMLCTVTSPKDKTYAGLKQKDAYQFCRELGYNSVFYLDGGGSSTFVTLEDGSCTERNKCSDGSPRIVINSIGVVWNDQPVCEQQGSLSYIDIAVDLSTLPATHLDGALLEELVGGPNAVDLSYDETERAFVMTTNQRTNDPYASLSFADLLPISADEYKYMVFRVKTDHQAKTRFKLYCAAGSVTGPSEASTRSFNVPTGDEWQYITVDLSKLSAWNGTIHNIRLDIFDGTYTDAGYSMYISDIVLCKTAEEAAKVQDGWLPEGCIEDYLAYKESLKPQEPETETETVTEPATEPVTEPVTEPETEPATEPVTEPVTEPETETVTEPETEPVTVLETEEITEPATETDVESATAPATETESATGIADEGCTSSLSLGALAVVFSAMAGAVALNRRKEREK